MFIYDMDDDTEKDGVQTISRWGYDDKDDK